MKKLIFLAAFLVLSGAMFGQTLEKGNLIGTHVFSVNLDPDVTMNQFLDAYKTKVLPEYEKNFEAKCYLVKSIRGVCENCYGVIIIFKSQAVRDKYWKEDGSLTDLGHAGFERMQPVNAEMQKFGEFTSKYTDWLVQ